MAHLKTVINLDRDVLVKPWLRVEHNADDAIIDTLIPAAIDEAHMFLCREFTADADELAGIKLACLLAITYWYENRGDTKLPETAKDKLREYRFEPGF